METHIPQRWQSLFTFAEAEYLHWSWQLYLHTEPVDWDNMDPDAVYAMHGGEHWRDTEVACILDNYENIAVDFPQIADGGQPMIKKLNAMTGAEINAMLRYLDMMITNTNLCRRRMPTEQLTLRILHYDLIPAPLTFTVPRNR